MPRASFLKHLTYAFQPVHVHAHCTKHARHENTCFCEFANNSVTSMPRVTKVHKVHALSRCPMIMSNGPTQTIGNWRNHAAGSLHMLWSDFKSLCGPCKESSAIHDPSTIGKNGRPGQMSTTRVGRDRAGSGEVTQWKHKLPMQRHEARYSKVGALENRTTFVRRTSELIRIFIQ